MPWVKVSQDKTTFLLEPSGKSFTPWGLNYDHDHTGRPRTIADALTLGWLELFQRKAKALGK